MSARREVTYDFFFYCSAPFGVRAMTLERLERVLWRLRKNIHSVDCFDAKDLTIAIMRECGTDPRTVRVNIQALLALAWIEKVDEETFSLTGRDLNG